LHDINHAPGLNEGRNQDPDGISGTGDLNGFKSGQAVQGIFQSFGADGQRGRRLEPVFPPVTVGVQHLKETVGRGEAEKTPKKFIHIGRRREIILAADLGQDDLGHALQGHIDFVRQAKK
jgi:hypothetical protein